MQKLTLKKIAKELDVSISTVSKALKDSPEIGAETKKKIQAFAELYNYRPNNIALSLKNQKTRTLGVIIPEIVHHFFTTVVSGIEEVANQQGYTVIIGLSNESFEKEVTNMDKLANGSIDGFILSVSKETQLKQDYHHLNESIDQGMPIVMFDRVISQIECDKVVVDDQEGARKAVARLIQLGCKHVAICSTEDHISVGKLRTAGYHQALEEAGMAADPDLILRLQEELNAEDQQDALLREIQSFLMARPQVDGVFAVNEKYALTAIKALQGLGRNVPHAVKVFGFTDGVLSRFASPSLSTVSQHGKDLGRKAAELLIDRIEKGDFEPPFSTVVVATELVERESTKS